VPFKRSHKTGIVIDLDRSTYSASVKKRQGKLGRNITLKPVTSILDEEPFLSAHIIRLIKWVAQYYMSTTGLALKNAVPSAFFTGKKAGRSRIMYDEEIIRTKTVRLTGDQKKALSVINSEEKGVFLVHGVTGSGKTEIYMRAISALPDAKKAIVLVPEIAITAQMIDRFHTRFGEEVVFFHSGLSTGERLTQWLRIRNGEVRVVIGVRSAVFAPFMDIGLIIIDEEQEASYKQFEGLRYSARDVALARAKLENFKIILGSATPSLEAYHAAKTGTFHYIIIDKRIESKPLPDVEIIDMTKETRDTFTLSAKLVDALRENVHDHKQSLIMLNRRGYSPYFLCTACGYIHKCPLCSISLIYHKDTNTLNCHYCGSWLDPGPLCPQCGGKEITYLGAGTQRVEEDLKRLIPELSFKRMDRDTTQKKLSHFRIVRQMEEKKIDLLLGTQMVSKGHDFPDVTISAVISADTALNLPDFRSAERAFQLFTQLAGRAGRGEFPGKAYIQTYEPDHYVFDYVRLHDCRGFYEKEIEQRKELNYPPFSKLVRIILGFRTKEKAKKITSGISARIRTGRHKNIEVLGPSPAPVEKIRNLWRWHLILKGRNAKELRRKACEIAAMLEPVKDIKIDIDVDPINLL
jgi:primosomal protein N' (replication factor Y)